MARDLPILGDDRKSVKSLADKVRQLIRQYQEAIRELDRCRDQLRERDQELEDLRDYVRKIEAERDAIRLQIQDIINDISQIDLD